MKLIKGEFKEKLDLLFAPSLKAGFPSPAEDYLSETLDFNKDLIKHPEATFYAQIDGDSMTQRGLTLLCQVCKLIMTCRRLNETIVYEHMTIFMV